MRKLVVILTVALTTASGAKVWVTAYRCDEVTPLATVDPNQPTVYRDIMVGTKLALIISSDAPGYWIGRLQLSWDNEKYATLNGKGPMTPLPDSPLHSYADSCLEAAGTRALARDYQNLNGIGLELRTTLTGGRTGAIPAVPGDWFVADYRARQTGACRVDLYDLLGDPTVPVQTLSFTHVPSRDFNGDTVVDFRDFTLLAAHWDSAVTVDPNSSNGALDLSRNTRVDFADLALFSEYWLERTDCSKPGADPNYSPPIL